MSMFTSNSALIGLDLGETTFKAVELSMIKGERILTAFAIRDVDPDLPRTDQLAETIAGGGFHTKRVASSVSGRSVTVRYINMPPMKPEDLAAALPLEADKYIPYDVEDVYLDGEPLPISSEDAQESKVMMVAAKKDLVHDQVMILDGAGLLPALIDVDVFALANAFEMAGMTGDAGSVVALVDIGGGKTDINILRGNVSCFTREVYVGGGNLTDAIVKRLGIDATEAERVKREPGDRMEEVQSAVAPVLDDLGNEVTLSFDFFESQFDERVGRVYLSGGGARLAGVLDRLQTVFARPTETWSPVGGIEVGEGVDRDALDACGDQLAVAVGLASRLGYGA